MIFSLLIAATVVFVLMIVGLSFLVFGREWLFARREKRFLLALGGHSGLFTRLQSTSAEEFEGAFRQLSAVADPLMREAILDILACLRDPDEWIRRASVNALSSLGRVDYLHRFGEDEGRGTAGAMRKWGGGKSVRVEGGISPDAQVFSRESLEAELAWPLSDRLVGYAGGKYAHYSVADVWNAVAALEWYVRGSNALYARYILNRTEFDSGGSDTNGTWLVKLVHFWTDDDRLWAYYSYGTEGYTTGTVDQIADISSHTFGIGGRIFPVPRWGFEGNVDWQDREGGHDYLTVSTLVVRRF